MTGTKPDERIRTPMRWDSSRPAAGFSTTTPWEALSDDPQRTDVGAESSDSSSLLATYRSLIQLRADHPALAHGDWMPVDVSAPGVDAYLRQADGETVLVVANLGDQPADDVALSLASGDLCGTPSVASLLGAGPVRSPAITSTGGFYGYVPVDRLGARETLAIRLAP
jgi:glycosidase